MTEEHLRARERGPEEPPGDYPPLPEALVVPVYDNHTHMEFADGDTPLDYREQLDRASSVGVRGVVQVGTDLETSRWSSEIAAREPRVLAAVAIHPNAAPAVVADGALDDQLESLRVLADRPRVRAIGETGLDFYRTGEEGRAAQYRSFEAHIAIAKEHDLALQIHSREAHREVIETLDRVGAPERTVFHCFSGDRDLADEIAGRGWFVSFAGTVTFKNALGLREALESIPRSQILIETDSPFLAPTPWRGRPNSSYLLPHTLRFMADHLGTDSSMLAAQISSNTELVYGRWDDQAVDPPTGPFEIPPEAGRPSDPAA